jgi:leader peptidase (prepilin peptidase) / N-methyltransferase
MQTLIYILVFIFGSCIGSFLNVVILRLPKEESLSGRSHCVHCGHTLSAADLLPVLSFAFLLGKCRYCRKPISPRYFIIEIITGLLFVLNWYLINPQNSLGYFLVAANAFIIGVLISVFVIDLEHYLILDRIIFPASAIMALANIAFDLLSGQSPLVLHSHFILGILAALAAALPFFAVWFFSKGAWMGFGDVKLMLFLGLALQWPNIFVAVFLSVVLGGILSAILLALKAKTLKSRLPFGTFLALGSLVAMFYGEHLLRWYLGLLGF